MSTVQTNGGPLSVPASMREFTRALWRALSATSQLRPISNAAAAARPAAKQMNDTIGDRPVAAFDPLVPLGELGRGQMEALSNHGISAAHFLCRMNCGGPFERIFS